MASGPLPNSPLRRRPISGRTPATMDREGHLASKTVCGFALVLVALAGCTVDNADFDPAVAWPPEADGAATPPPLDPDAGVSPDSQPKKSATPFSCTPFTFVACQSDKVMLRCGAKGRGVEKVPCTYGCNATARRCNQCTPSSPDTCEKDVKISCDAAGKQTKETCTYGCASGQCKDCPKSLFYKDGDGDGYGDATESKKACEKPQGYSKLDSDCDDDLKDVHPNQTSYFKDPISGTKSFDYNCDKKAEAQYPTATVAKCALKGGKCVGGGWLLLVPGCGAPGFYMDCVKKGSKPNDGCKEVVKGNVQRCR